MKRIYARGELVYAQIARDHWIPGVLMVVDLNYYKVRVRPGIDLIVHDVRPRRFHGKTLEEGVLDIP